MSGTVGMRGRMRRTRADVVVAMAGLALVLDGCSAYYLDESDWSPISSDLTGTWTNHRHDGVTPTLTFTADGTVTMTDIPFMRQDANARYGYIVNWNVLESGTGAWRSARNDGGANEVDIDLTPSTGSAALPTWLLAITDGKGKHRLFIVVGDPDLKNRLGFTKET